MVRHVVMWKLKDFAEEKTSAENAAILKERLEGLVGKIEGLISLEVVSGFTKDYDLCLLSEMKDRDALAFYAEHPLHDEVRQYVHKVIDARVVFDGEH